MIAQRLRTAFQAARDAAQKAARETGQQDETPPADSPRPAWALLHLGAEDGLEAEIALHRERCLASGLRCVVISNHFAQSLLNTPETVYEFAPVGMMSSYDADGEASAIYIAQRLAQTTAFWMVVQCSWAGTHATDLRRSIRHFAPAQSVLRL